MYKDEKPIKIDVNTDIFISKELYGKTLETLLKYILYLCQQIPVQIDVLEKEIAQYKKNSQKITGNVINEKIINKSDNTEINIPKGNVRTQLKEKAFQRRELQAKRMFERNRQRWLGRVEKFFHNYNLALTQLKQHTELENVKSILFAIGSSPLTPKFAFRIFAPNDLKNASESSSLHIDSIASHKKILLYLFRSFSNNADFAALTSQTFCLSKLWTLIEMEAPLSSPHRMEQSYLIPRHEFRALERTKVVEVHLRGKSTLSIGSNLETEMILTPCVGTWDRTHEAHRSIKEDRVKECLFSSPDDELNEDEELDFGMKPLFKNSPSPFCPPSMPISVPRSKTRNVSRLLTSPTEDKSQFLSCPNTPHVLYPTRILSRPTTPYVHSNGFAEMIETPVAASKPLTPSPMKKLARGISKFRLTSPQAKVEKPLVWYQVETAISGFKDVYLNTNLQSTSA